MNKKLIIIYWMIVCFYLSGCSSKNPEMIVKQTVNYIKNKEYDSIKSNVYFDQTAFKANKINSALLWNDLMELTYNSHDVDLKSHSKAFINGHKAELMVNILRSGRYYSFVVYLRKIENEWKIDVAKTYFDFINQ